MIKKYAKICHYIVHHKNKKKSCSLWNCWSYLLWNEVKYPSSVPVPHQIQKKSIRILHVPCDPSKNEKCRGRLPLLTDIGPPCAPWCTTHPSGAQPLSMVHNVVLSSLGGAQCRSDKPTRHKWNRQTLHLSVMWSIMNHAGGSALLTLEVNQS